MNATAEKITGQAMALPVKERAMLAHKLSTSLDPQRDAEAKAEWEVVIASAGCAWYIHKLLAHLEKLPAIHANPGRYVEGQGLLMSMPHGAQFFSPFHGVDKLAITKAAIAQVGKARVAYAGDGLTDVVPSLLVPEQHRFARSDLARVLTEKRQRFHGFERWAEVARQLIGIS